jgi:hypothetical protein
MGKLVFDGEYGDKIRDCVEALRGMEERQGIRGIDALLSFTFDPKTLIDPSLRLVGAMASLGGVVMEATDIMDKKKAVAESN